MLMHKKNKFSPVSAIVGTFQIGSVLHSLFLPPASTGKSKLCWAEPIWRVPVTTETLKPPQTTKTC